VAAHPAEATPQLVAYDRAAALAIVRDWTPHRLAAELRSGGFGRRLSHEQIAELEEHLTAWSQRALGPMPLRDALLVDGRRGRRVYALICADLTAYRAPLAPELASALADAPALAQEPELAALAARAEHEGLEIVPLAEPDAYPFPDNLDALLQLPPNTSHPPVEPFEHPTGWRRRIAVLLAAGGVLLLVVPMLGGQIPDHPAGLPLALLTLALLVGIRAGWTGYAGSACIWLVANLPGFRHGTDLRALWPALPLLAAGVMLLGRDRHVRTMWRWVRARLFQ
jgi:hypothetical protein